jgi:hypothetical protein
MQKTKRIVLLASLLLAAAVAQAQFTYTTNADGISVTLVGYSGSASALTIPTTNLSGLNVTMVGDGEDSVFGASPVSSVTVPDSVVNIAPFAFGYCSSLNSVTLGDNVTNIGNSAFQFCTGLRRRK